MGNVIEYLNKYGKYSFDEKEFNEVDNLILCQLSYLKFEEVAPALNSRCRKKSLMDIFVNPKRELLFADERFEVPNRNLFQAVAFSRRFQNMAIQYVDCQIDTEKQLQFAAMTFFLDEKLVYVGFRGTDETIIGWKEDFNMAFISPVPSQLLGVEYINKVGKKIKGKFMIGGHSKGGNIAVYSAMKCKKEIADRITKIYTNDGPGFAKDIFTSDDYNAIEDRIVKIVPQSSTIGMLLEHQEKYQVVESTGKGGIGQHDPFTWEIKDGTFVYRQDLNYGSKLFNEKLNSWVMNLGEKERMTFVETLYQIVSSTEAETLIELTDEWKDNSTKMVNAIKDIDAETKKMLKKTLAALFKIHRKK